MTCAEFEHALVRLLEEGHDAADRRSRLDSLQAHAKLCSECAPTSALLGWSGLNAEQRDLARDPGEAYWEQFTPRLMDRLAGETSQARPLWHGIAAVAAALLLAALVGSWRFEGPAATGSASLVRLDSVLERAPDAETLLRAGDWLGLTDDGGADEPLLPREWSGPRALVGLQLLAEASLPLDTPGEPGLPVVADEDGLDDEALQELLLWLNEAS